MNRAIPPVLNAPEWLSGNSSPRHPEISRATINFINIVTFTGKFGRPRATINFINFACHADRKKDGDRPFALRFPPAMARLF